MVGPRGGEKRWQIVDARQVRTSAKLAEVILRLASERLSSELTVSEITAAAGINRSTFYQHATSPTELLQNVLRGELDRIRLQFLDPEKQPLADTAIRDTTIAVLHHIDDRAALYSLGLGLDSASASLHPLLSRHFEESIVALMQHHNLRVPGVSDAERPSAAFVSDAAARYIADGTVGAIDAWLRTPAPRSVEEFMTAYRLLLPSWWPIGAV